MAVMIISFVANMDARRRVVLPPRSRSRSRYIIYTNKLLGSIFIPGKQQKSYAPAPGVSSVLFMCDADLRSPQASESIDFMR
jgi:hypothetical protein